MISVKKVLNKLASNMYSEELIYSRPNFSTSTSAGVESIQKGISGYIGSHDINYYDEFRVEFCRYNFFTTDGTGSIYIKPGGRSEQMIAIVGTSSAFAGTIYQGIRDIAVNTNENELRTTAGYGIMGSGSLNVDNHACIITKVYGIKYNN